MIGGRWQELGAAGWNHTPRNHTLSPHVPMPHPGHAGPGIAQINAACAEIIEWDVRGSECATFASVLYRFCQRAGVAHFEQLGLGPPQGVPCLRYLWRLQALVDPYIRSYAQLRAIATVADLEDELVALLNSFCFPSLPAFLAAATPPLAGEGGDGGANPDEIDIDADDADGEGAWDRRGHEREGGVVARRFAEFGVGSLLRHPMVAQFFRPPRAPVRLVRGGELVSLLVSYAEDLPLTAAHVFVAGGGLNLSGFESFAARKLGCETLASAGAVVQALLLSSEGNGADHGVGGELLMVRHLLANKRAALLRVAAASGVSPAGGSGADGGGEGINRRKRKALADGGSGAAGVGAEEGGRRVRQVPRLKEAADPEVRPLLTHIEPVSILDDPRAPARTHARTLARSCMSARSLSHTPPPPPHAHATSTGSGLC